MATDNQVYKAEIIENLDYLIQEDEHENFLGTLAVLSQLMVELLDKRLSGATYEREFKHSRIKLRVDVVAINTDH